jgi:ribosome-associated protein
MAKATRGGTKAKAKGKAGGKGKAASARGARKAAPRARPAGKRKAPARKGLKQAALRPARKPAPPAAPPAPVSEPVVAKALPPDEGQVRALAAVAAGADKKAENPVVLDVRGLSGVADYFVVLSADSDRQAAAVADAVDERLGAMGAHRLGAEGRSGGGWVLLDFGDVVVHVMSPEARGFYDLEGLWADAPRVKAS